MQCEEWSLPFTCLICSLLLLTLVWGGYLSSLSGALPVVEFGIVVFANFISAFHTACSPCYYYGKRCYTGFGLLVPFFFGKRHIPAKKFEERLLIVITAATIAYPLVVLLGAHDLSLPLIIHAVIYLIPPAALVFLVGMNCCPRCKNVGCSINHDKM
jgi:hypothetical protein